jgi:hypothetical protein
MQYFLKVVLYFKKKLYSFAGHLSMNDEQPPLQTPYEGRTASAAQADPAAIGRRL